MSDFLLTHGFFLAEDEIEQQVMKPYPPLGILYLSASLKKRGIRVEIFDSSFATRAQLHRRLQSPEPGVLGIYSTHMTRPSVVELASTAKNAGWTVVLGGPDSANYPAEYLDHGADVVVVGEGEATVAELLPALADKGAHRLHSIPGLVFLDEAGRITRTKPRTPLVIDSIPWPDRDGIDVQSYLDAWSDAHGITSLNVITQRGCPYSCRWCSHAVFGNTYRRRSPSDSADEVKHLIDRYGPSQLWIADDVFTLDHDWIHAYASECRSRGVRIPFETISRADRLMDADIIRELADLGCFRLWVGCESGSDRMLEAMGRGITADQVAWVTREAQRVGIAVGVFLMWGYEGETVDDMVETVEFISRAQPDVFFTTVVHPIKATPYYNDIEAKLVAPGDWAGSTDKDYGVEGRAPKEYYRCADRWLRASAAAASDSDSIRLRADAEAARAEFVRMARQREG